jgi:hypothetical protein
MNDDPGKLVGTVTIREDFSELRVTLHDFNGKRYLDIRRWERYAKTGEFGPTKAGIRFDSNRLEELLPVLENAAK